MNDCPDLETLATVIEGTASDEVRDSILEHVGTCKRCYLTFAGTTRTHLDQQAKAWRKKVKRVAPRIAASIAVLAIGVAVTWNLVIGPRLDERPIEPLVEAVQGRRVLEARLAGGFSQSPPQGPMRSAAPTIDRRERWRLAEAAVRVDRMARRRSSPGRIEALGLAHLLTEDLETASLLIQEALDRKPHDSVFLTDLAASEYSRYQAGAPEALIEALAAASAAAEERPESPEALFNKALILSTFHLEGEARLAWRKYATIETDGRWVAEARRREAELARSDPELDRDHLANLARTDGGLESQVAQHPQAIRTYVQETLLPRWGEEWLGGDASDESLQIAKRLADALVARIEDPMLVQAVREIQRASRDGNKTLVNQLARGHLSFGQGRKAFESLRLTDACPAFNRAQREFETASSPYALWARFWQQGCAYYRGKPHPELLVELGRLQEVAGESGYKILLARASWLEGLIYSNDLEPANSLAAYKTALKVMTAAGEKGHAAFLHYLISENYFILGDHRLGWQHRLDALKTASTVDLGKKHSSILVGTGILALIQDHDPAALYLFREANRTAKDDIGRTEARLWQARTLAHLGRHGEAAHLLNNARSQLANVPEPTIRARLQAEANIVTGLVSSPRDPTAAINHLSKALTFFETSGPTYRLPILRLERARTFLRAGEEEKALADLETGFNLLQQKDESLAASLYQSVFGGAEQLVDMLVGLRARDSPLHAFTTAEKARGPHKRATSLREIQNSLPTSSAMLYYSLHPEELLIWTVTPTRATFTRRKASEDEIRRLTERFLRSFTLDDELTNAPGSKLAEILIASNPLLQNASTIVVIPDGSLQNIPFSALPDPRSNGYLTENSAVIVAPNATKYLRARQARRNDVKTALIVGAPAPDPEFFPELPSLPGAQGEARTVASLYPNSDLLLGRMATRDAFVAEAQHHDIIHFAGHATTQALVPSMAGLVLSPKPNDSSLLLAHEVSSLDLTRVRLVVLSACSTGTKNPRGTTTESLAQAFLTAGAPSVLASLWPLDDATTSPIVASFHRHFLRGLSPAQALRAAQLEALRSNAARSSWAAFQIIGS